MPGLVRLAFAIAALLVGAIALAYPESTVRADSSGTAKDSYGLEASVRCKAFEDKESPTATILCKIRLKNTFFSQIFTDSAGIVILDGNFRIYSSETDALARVGDPKALLSIPDTFELNQTVAGYMAFSLPITASPPLQLVAFSHQCTGLADQCFAGNRPENASVPLDLEPWRSNPQSESQSTVAALETEIAALETAAVPTETQTSVPSDTPVPTNTPVPTATGTPIPTETATPLPDQATIAALETRKAELSTTRTPGTLVTSPTSTPKPRATDTRRSRATNTPGASSRYPAAVAELVREDSPSECDRIGWSVYDEAGDQRSDIEERFEYYGACGEPVAYFGGCLEADPQDAILGPSPGNVWVVCSVTVFNAGSDDVFISPLDFALVDAGNTRYDLDYTAIALGGPDELFPSMALPPEQNAGGLIAFQVPSSGDRPLRLEIDRLLDYSGRSEPMVIIMDPIHRRTE